MLIYASAPPVPVPVPVPASRFPYLLRSSAYSPTTEFLLYSCIYLVSYNRTISVRSNRFPLRKYFISYPYRLYHFISYLVSVSIGIEIASALHACQREFSARVLLFDLEILSDDPPKNSPSSLALSLVPPRQLLSRVASLKKTF